MPHPKRDISSCPASKIGSMLLSKPPAIDLSCLEDIDNAFASQSLPVTPSDNWPPTLPPTPANYEGGIATEPWMHSSSFIVGDAIFDLQSLTAPAADVRWLWEPSVPPGPPVSP